MLIRDVLRRKGEHVVTVPPETLVAGLLDTLATRNIGAVVVSTDGSSVQGIVSERDVVRGLRTRGPLLLTTRPRRSRRRTSWSPRPGTRSSVSPCS